MSLSVADTQMIRTHCNICKKNITRWNWTDESSNGVHSNLELNPSGNWAQNLREMVWSGVDGKESADLPGQSCFSEFGASGSAQWAPCHR
jgi:hypothetical protein